MEQSFAALQEYFSPSRQHENASNPAQLVLFAEHAVKVKSIDGGSYILMNAHRRIGAQRFHAGRKFYA